MDEQPKQAVETPPQPQPTPLPVNDITQPSPVVAQTQPSTELRPNEWFQPDNSTDIPKPQKSSAPRVRIITGVIVIGAIVVGLGTAVVSRNMTKEEVTQTAEQSTETASQNNELSGSEESPATETASEDGDEEAEQTAGNTGQTQIGSGSTILPSGGSSPTHSISYTFSGCYSPANMTIKLGDTIKFTNEDSKKDMWPASDNHPTHEEYSEFDSKTAIAPGGSWSFTFTKKGVWDYHDHLKSSCGGVITVT